MLETLVVAVGGKIISKLSDEATNKLLHALLEIKSEERVLLEKVDRNVQLLLEGPFNSGVLMLEQASRPYRLAQDRAQLIAAARERFTDALGLEYRSPIRKCIIELNLGLCWLMLGSERDAWHYTQQAYYTLVDHAVESAWQDNMVPETRLTDWFRQLPWQEFRHEAEHRQEALEKFQAMAPYLDALWLILVRLGADPQTFPRYAFDSDYRYVEEEIGGKRIRNLDPLFKRKKLPGQK